MKMQNTQRIVGYSGYCGCGISLASMLFLHHNAHFGTPMLRIEVENIYHSYLLACLVLHNHAHLSVVIDVVCRVGDIVVQHIARIRHTGIADVPHLAVVLHSVEPFEVFGFHGAQHHFRLLRCAGDIQRRVHLNTSSLVIIVFVAGL